MFVLGRISDIRQRQNMLQIKTTPFFVWEVFLALLVFAFVSGVRWRVGVDHQFYLDNYLKIQNFGYSVVDKEMGFEFITTLFARLNIHFSIYFGFLAFLQILFIYLTFKKERYLYSFLGIIIIFGSEYLSWMNGIRQMLAATIFVFSIQFIQKRQLLKYFIAIFIASLFHSSAILLIIFYFLPNKDFFKNKKITLLLVIASLVLGNMTFWINYLTKLTGLLEFIGYDWYSSNLEILIDDSNARNIGPRRLSMMIGPLIVIWFSDRLKISFKNTYFLAYYNLGIFGFLLYNIVSNLNHGFIRPVTYLTIFIVPISAYLLVYLKRNVSNLPFVFFISFMIILSYLPLSIIADYGKGQNDYTNYKFYWYHHDK